MPKVSIITASYNHEKFIKKCIGSVLGQSFKDFEYIIIDDCSNDNSVNIIKRFDDVRIKLSVNDENSGQFVTAKKAIRLARGEYIAIINSDDMWEPEKLQKQVDFLDKNPEYAAVFTNADLIDENDRSTGIKCESTNRNRFEWLNILFNGCTCLCHPSVLIRKSVHDEIGYYECRMAMGADMEFWVRLCGKYEIFILQEELTKFRLLNSELNEGADKQTSRVARVFELNQILSHFLLISDLEDFKKIFYNKKEAQNPGDKELIPYYLGKFALESELDSYKHWGIRAIYNAFSDEKIAEKIKQTDNFTYKNLINLIKNDPVYTEYDKGHYEYKTFGYNFKQMFKCIEQNFRKSVLKPLKRKLKNKNYSL